MSEEQKEFWILGEHYRFETPLYTAIGKLVGLTDSELIWSKPAFPRDTAGIQLNYHDETKHIVNAKEFIVSRAQVCGAGLWEPA